MACNSNLNMYGANSMQTSTPIVTIIGRPNVGKSTLFNAIIGERKSIVSDVSGTTRDSLMAMVSFQEHIPFWLVDTAGLTDFSGKSLEKEVQTQVELSIDNADLIIFLIDGKNQFTSDDHKILDKLRKSKIPVIFVANKIDDGQDNRVLEFAEHGMGIPIALSAKNYTNIWALHEEVEEILNKSGFKKEETQEVDENNILKIAFVGRPNVGKSSLLNAFVGKERSVVSDIPGTTRDTIDTQYTDESEQEYLFLDTAGLRKKGKLGRKIEFWSSVRTTKAIERADICILMIDALEGVTHQDLAIAGEVVKAGKGIIIGVNKFDLVREQSRNKNDADEREVDEIKMWGESIEKIRKKYLSYLHKRISFLPWAPVLFFSAKTGKGIIEILTSAKAISNEQIKRIPTAELNKWVPEIFYGHVTPSVGTRLGKIKYVSQVDVIPPKFIFFVNNTDAFHFSYRRYLENKIREKYGFFGTPIRIEMRDSKER